LRQSLVKSTEPHEVEMDQLRALDDAKLLELVSRLQRRELDFADRLVNRLDAVRDPSYPMGDHAYRRMSYTLDHLKAQRAEAQRELSRRAVPACERTDVGGLHERKH
jgi:hypothetical protein